MNYSIFTANSKTEKRLKEYLLLRLDIRDKLDRLKTDPRRNNGAHPLHGRLAGKWACWLGSNIRMIYSIDDKEKIIIIEAIGTHKIY
ncbi:MAG: type II toxin-antitoxin system mRNA interferase toxin, RelE/StbE family [Nanoarchaeota archaeon]